MAQTAKSLLVLVILGYGASVFIFEKDPLGLVLKKKTGAQAAVAYEGTDFTPRTRQETEVLATRFIKMGVTRGEIERKFRTTGEPLGPVFKRTFLVGEAKYNQYRFDLGHGVIAYVLFDTFSNRVANHGDALKFNERH